MAKTKRVPENETDAFAVALKDKYRTKPDKDGKRPLNIHDVLIKDIIADQARCQARVMTYPETVDKYYDLMEGGLNFPPLVGFYDPKTGKVILCDGFHRLAAAIRKGMTEFKVEILFAPNGEDPWRHAIYYAAGANTGHGKPLERDDVQKAIKMILSDPEWGSASNWAIGRHIGATGETVRLWRKKLGIQNPHSNAGGAASRGQSKVIINEFRDTRALSGKKWACQIDGKNIYLSSVSRDEARMRLDEIMSGPIEIDSSRPRSVVTKIRKRIPDYCDLEMLVPAGGFARKFSDIVFKDGIIVLAEKITQSGFPEIAGRALMAREPGQRAIVFCNLPSDCKEYAERANGLGVEFMTPDEFVLEMNAKAAAEYAADETEAA